MGIYINMLRQIESYLEHGQTSQADELATSLVHLTHRDLATHPQELADCLVRIANAFASQGSPEKALPLFEEAVPLMRTAPDRDSESFSESVEALGNLYYERAMYEKAKPLLREALDLYRPPQGKTTPAASVA